MSSEEDAPKRPFRDARRMEIVEIVIDKHGEVFHRTLRVIVWPEDEQEERERT